MAKLILLVVLAIAVAFFCLLLTFEYSMSASALVGDNRPYVRDAFIHFRNMSNLSFAGFIASIIAAILAARRVIRAFRCSRR
jgi:hypothetical protein